MSVVLGHYRGGEEARIGDIWKCRALDNPEEGDCIYLNESRHHENGSLLKVVYSYNNGVHWQGNITIRPSELSDYYFVRKNKKQKTGFASFIDRTSGLVERNTSV